MSLIYCNFYWLISTTIYTSGKDIAGSSLSDTIFLTSYNIPPKIHNINLAVYSNDCRFFLVKI